MSKVLTTVGIVNPISQANIILINNCQQFCWALLGAALVDRVGRRPLLLFSNIGCCIVWLAMTISASMYQDSIPAVTSLDPKPIGTNKTAGAAALAFIFIFGAVYSIGFTPLQALYPVEVLSFEMRAKGMGFSGFAVAAGMLALPPGSFTSSPSYTSHSPQQANTQLPSRPPQPIRLARRNGQDRLAHVHHLHNLVRHPSDNHLLLHPRDKKPHAGGAR